jgi:hypothetical protein
MATEPRRPGHIGHCDAHGKRLYASRKAAKRHARRAHPGANLSAYECDATHGSYWHLGNLPQAVVSGQVSRATIVNTRYDTPTD